jgi:hypothetical protein
MSLCRRGFLAREDLEGHVPAICFQPVVQFLHALCLKPAGLASRNQDRAFDVSRNPAEHRSRESVRIRRRDEIPQERSFIQVPDTAVTNRRCKTIIERDSPRHKGRTPSIRQDCNSMLVDIVSFDEIIHDLSDCRFQIGTADDLLESSAGPCAQKVHRKHRHGIHERMRMKESRVSSRLLACRNTNCWQGRVPKQAFDGRAEERGPQDKPAVFNRCDRAVINSRKKKPADAGSFAL